MRQRLGLLLIVVGLLGLAAAAKPSSISGYVRNTRGVPQMGAAVEVIGSAPALKAFTDAHGFYSFGSILPGVYTLKASLPSFMPAMRESVGVGSGAHLVVNMTLNTLFEAIQMAPLRGATDDDDWKWTLRSVSNRPILRALDDGTAVLVSSGEGKDGHELKGSMAFLAGSAAQGYGSSSDMSTRFSVERSLFSTGTISLLGDVGYGQNSPAAIFRTSYSHRMANGSEPQFTVTARRLSAPDPTLHTGALQALALDTSDQITLGHVLELKFGSELQTIEFMGRMNALQPYGAADLHLSPNTVLEYQYTSSVPNTRMEKGFDSAPADLTESGPRMSIDRFASSLERAHHQELSLSRRLGGTRLQVAAFTDRIADPALSGVGETGIENGQILPDPYSGTFTYQGRDLATGGLRVVAQHKLAPGLTGTLDYAYGGVLDLSRPGIQLQQAQEWMKIERRHAVAGKLSGNVPHLKTHWLASYRWTDGEALTPVDLFNTSAGQTDPFLNVFIRQPIPGLGFLPGHVEFLLDMRNLLAQGYVPVMGQDGHTVYLVQSARSVRGGLAFSF